MEERRVPLTQLFGAVTRSMAENQAYLNSLDGSDGDAGDNSLYNWQVVEQAVKRAERRNPDAGFVLASAAEALQTQGRGKTAGLYANGLANAAPQFQGQTGMAESDFEPLMRGMTSGIQSAGAPAFGQGSPLDALLPGVLGYLAAKQRGANNTDAILSGLGQAAGTTGMAGGSAQPGGGLGSLLGGLLGGMGGGQSSPGGGYGESPQGGAGGDPLSDLLGGLLGGMAGGGQAPPPQRGGYGDAPQGDPLSDLLGGLLGGMAGGGQRPPPQRDNYGDAPQGGAGGDLLSDLLGGLLGGMGGGQMPPQRGGQGPSGGTGGDSGDPLSDLLGGLLGGAQGGQMPAQDPYTPPAQEPPASSGDEVLGRLSDADLGTGLHDGGRQGVAASGLTPPAQPDPGAASGAALMEGLLRGFTEEPPPTRRRGRSASA